MSSTITQQILNGNPTEEHTAVTKTVKPSLMALPSDIRARIFSHLFTDLEIRTCNIGYRCRNIVWHRYARGILQASRQLRLEATPLFWNNVTIRIQVDLARPGLFTVATAPALLQKDARFEMLREHARHIHIVQNYQQNPAESSISADILGLQATNAQTVDLSCLHELRSVKMKVKVSGCTLSGTGKPLLSDGAVEALTQQCLELPDNPMGLHDRITATYVEAKVVVGERSLNNWLTDISIATLSNADAGSQQTLANDRKRKRATADSNEDAPVKVSRTVSTEDESETEDWSWLHGSAEDESETEDWSWLDGSAEDERETEDWSWL